MTLNDEYYPTSSCIHDEQKICIACTKQIEDRLGSVEPMEICACEPHMMCDNCKPSQLWLDKVTERFITKDSGKREEYDSGMRRDTQDGKPRFDLLLPDGIPFEGQFLTRFAALLERGATKYGESNWTRANSHDELRRFRASALRHMMQWSCGEVDEDHAAAVAFNLMAAEYVKWKLANEDPTL